MQGSSSSILDVLRSSRPRSIIELDPAYDRMLLVEHGELTIYARGHSHIAPAGHLVMLAVGERVELRGAPGLGGFELASVRLHEPVLEWFEQKHRLLLRDLADLQHADQLVFSVSKDTRQLWAAMTSAVHAQQPSAMVEHWLHGILLQLTLEGHHLPFLFRSELPLRRRVERLLTQDVAHEWAAGDVASTLGMSEPTLRRRLAAEGTSYRALLEDTRMNHALQLLMSTSMPIAHVAHAVGYASASRFSIRFSERYGISPGMLRSVRHESAALL